MLLETVDSPSVSPEAVELGQDVFGDAPIVGQKRAAVVDAY
jgi:hypothetical protein